MNERVEVLIQRENQMKNNKQCPKCQSCDVVLTKSAETSPSQIAVADPAHPFLTAGHRVYLQRYVCCNCGYVEEWVPAEELEKLRYAYP